MYLYIRHLTLSKVAEVMSYLKVQAGTYNKNSEGGAEGRGQYIILHTPHYLSNPVGFISLPRTKENTMQKGLEQGKGIYLAVSSGELDRTFPGQPVFLPCNHYSCPCDALNTSVLPCQIQK